MTEKKVAKKEFVKLMAERSGRPASECEKLFSLVFEDILADCLKMRVPVYIRNVGSFRYTTRKAANRVSGLTGKPTHFRESTTVRFKSAQEIKEALNGR